MTKDSNDTGTMSDSTAATGDDKTGIAKRKPLFEDQIRAMLRDGESAETIGCWLMRQAAAMKELRDEDLTPYEVRWFKEIERGYRS
jgi:L-arabinose isomerase